VDTNALIESLAGDAKPVRPLSRPLVRATIWIALAAPYVALVVAVMPQRPDFGLKLTDARFLVEQAAALATAITAAVAAFAMVAPGQGRKAIGLPVVPLAVWIGSLGVGCVQDWIHVGSAGLLFELDLQCLPKIVLIGAVPAITMAVMLRRGAPLRPWMSATLGGLAAAALGDFGLRIFHPEDASLMVLVWQLGAVLLLVALSGWAGQYLLSWPALVVPTRRRVIGR
jgi:hypothetical protein